MFEDEKATFAIQIMNSQRSLKMQKEIQLVRQKSVTKGRDHLDETMRSLCIAISDRKWRALLKEWIQKTFYLDTLIASQLYKLSVFDESTCDEFPDRGSYQKFLMLVFFIFTIYCDIQQDQFFKPKLPAIFSLGINIFLDCRYFFYLYLIFLFFFQNC